MIITYKQIITKELLKILLFFFINLNISPYDDN